MTPELKIMRTILERAASNDNFEKPEDWDAMSDERLAEVFGEYEDEAGDEIHDFREGSVETDLPSKDYSRHYEQKEVADQMFDGSWVGWTYWYGGGKHGEPEGIEWMSDAYDLNVTEEQKMVTVQTFAKVAK